MKKFAFIILFIVVVVLGGAALYWFYVAYPNFNSVTNTKINIETNTNLATQNYPNVATVPQNNLLDISDFQINKQDFARAESFVNKNKNIDFKELAEDVSDLCKLSLPASQTSNFIAALSSYAQAKGYQLNIDELKQVLQQNGLAHIYVYAKQKYNLDEDETEDLICATVRYVTQNFDPQQKETDYSATPSSVNPSAILNQNNADTYDLAEYLALACGTTFTPETAYARLNEITSQFGQEISAIDFNSVEPQQLVTFLAAKFEVPEADVRAIICK